MMMAAFIIAIVRAALGEQAYKQAFFHAVTIDQYISWCAGKYARHGSADASARAGRSAMVSLNDSRVNGQL